LPPSAVSFIVIDEESGRPVISQNAELPRSPASTLKAITTYASLDLLGPAYTWHTRALAGPDLARRLERRSRPAGRRRSLSDARALVELRAPAARLRAATIHGDIVVDNSAFSPPAEDPGAFDGRPNRVYNATPDALMVNFQSIHFRVVPNAEERRVDILAEPAPSNLVIDNRIRYARAAAAAPRAASISRSPRHARIGSRSPAGSRHIARRAS
jgi:serine-type D-Ala-D-Ala carboxypeptidase/endopeptidase (penicillin-binding protein 4)